PDAAPEKIDFPQIENHYLEKLTNLEN
ncbi:SRPBCC family protein, partial [Enterococcus faecium]